MIECNFRIFFSEVTVRQKCQTDIVPIPKGYGAVGVFSHAVRVSSS
jgi:hypothetical protein